MKVSNVHQRELAAAAPRVGELIDGLASPRDALWPRDVWPRMELDRPLAVGAVGGHGPVRYSIEDYFPGRSIRFRFRRPVGFDGYHGCEVVEASPGCTLLRHVLKMDATGPARLTWPLVFRPLHDALVEDAMARAEAAVGMKPTVQPWSLWVRFLRWILTRGRARPQALMVEGAALR